jgi:hypothetical protein
VVGSSLHLALEDVAQSDVAVHQIGNKGDHQIATGVPGHGSAKHGGLSLMGYDCVVHVGIDIR